MKRLPTLLLVLIMTAACSLPSATQSPPPAAPTVASVSPTSVPAAATATPGTMLYISATMHIESKFNSWPQDTETFLAYLQQTTDAGVHWSIGGDIGWLEGDPHAQEIIQRSTAMGVQWDVHAHKLEDRAKVAYLISQMGGNPSSVVSGMVTSEMDGMRQPLTYQGYTWTPRILWGASLCNRHAAECDDTAAGIWIPLSPDQYQTHDPSGTLIEVSGGTHKLADARALAQAIAAGQYAYPVISFTVMVSPSSLKSLEIGDGLQEGGDGLEQIMAFANEMISYSFVRFATIEETAQAWVQAGSMPSRIEIP